MKSDNYYETEEYIFFYGSAYSQWALRDIIIDNKKFNCCEQYMMFRKALLFLDTKAASEIMETNYPSKQKALGRKVKNFDKNKWEAIAKDVVFKANWAKFTQHKDLQKQLLDSGDKIIVEASPYDRIWGVGLKATDSKILDPSKWRGTNWLGETIMKVRANLLQIIKVQENI